MGAGAFETQSRAESRTAGPGPRTSVHRKPHPGQSSLREMLRKPRKEGFLLVSIRAAFLAKRHKALDKNRANQGSGSLAPPATVLRGHAVLQKASYGGCVIGQQGSPSLLAASSSILGFLKD